MLDSIFFMAVSSQFIFFSSVNLSAPFPPATLAAHKSNWMLCRKVGLTFTTDSLLFSLSLSLSHSLCHHHHPEFISCYSLPFVSISSKASDRLLLHLLLFLLLLSFLIPSIRSLIQTAWINTRQEQQQQQR